MIRAFFEGGAGCGKTHELVQKAKSLMPELVVHEHQRLLVLSYMNGARLRLTQRFSQEPQLRRRFVCSTFDSFAAAIVRRQRSLLRYLPRRAGDGLDPFEAVCADACQLLRQPSVSAWVSACYPVVIVDEAQDLDPLRREILEALDSSSTIVAAADEFQNLRRDIDPSPTLSWLRSSDGATILGEVRRTNKAALLAVATTIRSAQDVRTVLKKRETNDTKGKLKKRWFEGEGIRLVDVPAKQAALVAWTVANELRLVQGRAVIITPDGKGDFVKEVLQHVHDKTWSLNKAAGTTFGPYPVSWVKTEANLVAQMTSLFPSGDTFNWSVLTSALRPQADAETRVLLRRVERWRSVTGRSMIGRAKLDEWISDIVRVSIREGRRVTGTRPVVTVHGAKNREFENVIVLWPHSIPPNADEQRRLLYNAITRAKNHCSVVVFGQRRFDGPPFAP